MVIGSRSMASPRLGKPGNKEVTAPPRFAGYARQQKDSQA